MLRSLKGDGEGCDRGEELFGGFQALLIINTSISSFPMYTIASSLTRLR
jgi:hypothetical protein